MKEYAVLVNDNGSRKPKYSEKNLSQYHLVNHKFQMDWIGVEPVPSL
jgi:hypothetical protein